MKNLTNLHFTPFSNDEVMKLIKLYQFKGKDFYYDNILKPDLDSIVKKTIETECFEMVKYLNLNITDNRKNLIIKKNSQPKNNEEKLVANIKYIFTKIHSNPYNFETIPNEILLLGKLLFKDITQIAFVTHKYKVQKNLLEETKTVSSRTELEELLNKYEALVAGGNYELTNVITNFYIDFINMKVFNHGNELIGLILLFTLLYKEQFNLFRYVSFMELINVHRHVFDDYVLQANFNYEEGYSKVAPLQKLLIDMMLEGYNKIEVIVKEYKFDSALNKSDNIESTIFKFHSQIFTKDDIRREHPYTSLSTINRTLQRLRDENLIRPTGVGRSAAWIRLVDREKFDPEFKQLDLFEFCDEEE